MRLRKGKVVDYHGRLWRIDHWTHLVEAIAFYAPGRRGDSRIYKATGVMLTEHGRPRRQARAAFAFTHELRPASRRLRRWAHEERVSQQKRDPWHLI